MSVEAIWKLVQGKPAGVLHLRCAGSAAGRTLCHFHLGFRRRGRGPMYRHSHDPRDWPDLRRCKQCLRQAAYRRNEMTSELGRLFAFEHGGPSPE